MVGQLKQWNNGTTSRYNAHSPPGDEWNMASRTSVLVAIMGVSLWWLLKILCSHTPWSCLVLTPAAGAGPTHTHCRCQSCHSHPQQHWSCLSHLLPVPGAGADHPGGLLHLTLLLRGDWDSICPFTTSDCSGLLCTCRWCWPQLLCMRRAGAISAWEWQQGEWGCQQTGNQRPWWEVPGGGYWGWAENQPYCSLAAHSVLFKMHKFMHWALSM